MDSPSVIDLFSGAGGFTLGAHLAGFETVLAIDNNDDLTSCFPVNFPKTKLLKEDLFSYSAADALIELGLAQGELDGIIGGPPCQGFSIIGLRNPKDPRNDLIARFFQFVKDAAPAFFMMENVPNILLGPFKDILDRGLEIVRSDYVLVGPMVVDAARLGAATARPRMIVVGYDPDRVDALHKTDIRAAEHSEKTGVYEAIHDLPTPAAELMGEEGQCWAHYASEPDEGKRGNYARAKRVAPPIGLSTDTVRARRRQGLISGNQPTKHTEKVSKRYGALAPGDPDPISKTRRLTWDDPCITLRAGTGSERGSFQAVRPIHPAEPRVISVREAARIQGFPDWFQFHPTKWHSFRMIGNSVSPYLAKALLSLVEERLRIMAPVAEAQS